MSPRTIRADHGSRSDGRIGIAALAGGTLALFVLLGRWDVSRVSDLSLGFFGEPRAYLVFGLVFFALALPPRVTNRREASAVEKSSYHVAAFFGYMIASSAWAPDLAAAGEKSAELLLLAVAILSTIRICARVTLPVFSRSLWKWLLLGLLALAASGLVSSVASGSRLSVLGGGPNVFGRNMALLGIYAALHILSRKRTAIFAAIAVASASLVVLSGSRGAIVAFAAGATALLFSHRKNVSRIALTIVLVVTAGIVIVQSTSFGAEISASFQSRVIELSLEDRHDSGRSEIYLKAWDLGKESWLFGTGLSGFATLGNHRYPHNLFLETFCEGGILGIFLLARILAQPIRIAFRGPGPATVNASAFMVALAASQFSGDLFDSRVVFVFAILVSLHAPPSVRRRGGESKRYPKRSRSAPAPTITASTNPL